MKYVVITLLTALLLPSCRALQGNPAVRDMIEAFRDAPMVFETVYRGRTVRIVLQEGKPVAVAADGTVEDTDAVLSAAAAEARK